MKTEGFLDTNILVYAAAGRRHEPRKQAIARRLVAEVEFGVSAQSLAEFYVAVGRKAALALPLDEIDEWIESLSQRPFVPVDQSVVRDGIFLSRRYGIKYYDAALLAAAERLGAATFYSEDLNHNQLYGSVRVLNPFLEN